MKCCCGTVDEEPPPTRSREQRREREGRRRPRVDVPCERERPPPQLTPTPTLVTLTEPIQRLPQRDRVEPEERHDPIPMQPLPQIQLPQATLLQETGKTTIDINGMDVYFNGPVPGTENEPSLQDQPIETEDELTTFVTAKNAIAAVRKMLPKGPFNNRGDLDENIKLREPYPDYSNALILAMSGEAFEQLQPLMEKELGHKLAPEELVKLSSVCKSEATKRVGGGVCSMIATMTTCMLTSMAQPGTEICQVCSEFSDHEYVIIKYGTSRWMLVDPWTLTSHVVPFSDALFGPGGVSKYFKVTVDEQAEDGKPFGIDPSLVDWDAIEQKMRKEFGPPDDNYGEMAKNFSNPTNMRFKSAGMEDYEAAGATAWG